MYIKTIFKALLFISLLISNSGCQEALATDEIEAKSILKKIEKGENIQLKNKTITGDIDFTKTKSLVPEANGIFRAHIHSSLTFFNCTFKGKIIGFKQNKDRNRFCTDFHKNVSFIDCQMEDEVTFRDAIIRGQCNFVKTVFQKDALFEGACFYYKDTYYSEAIFKGKAKFQRSVFSGNVHFLKSDFLQTVTFQNTVSDGIMQFGNAQFENYAEFTKIKTSGLICNYASFSGPAIFDHSVISDRADFNDCKFSDKASFNEVKFNTKVNFNRSSFSYGADFTEAIFFIDIPDFTDTEINNIIYNEAIIIEGKEKK